MKYVFKLNSKFGRPYRTATVQCVDNYAWSRFSYVLMLMIILIFQWQLEQKSRKVWSVKLKWWSLTIGLAGNTRWTTTAQTGVQIGDMTNGSFPPRNVFKDNKKICSIHKVQTQAMISGPVIALLYTNNETARNAVQFFPNQERRICCWKEACSNVMSMPSLRGSGLFSNSQEASLMAVLQLARDQRLLTVDVSLIIFRNKHV